MTTYDELVKSGFHDNLLVAVNHEKSLIVFTIEYYDEDDNEKSVEVSISGVDQILRENVVTQGFKMEASYGSIIALEQENGDVALLLNWIHFVPNSSVMCYYKMLGAKIDSVV